MVQMNKGKEENQGQALPWKNVPNLKAIITTALLFVATTAKRYVPFLNNPEEKTMFYFFGMCFLNYKVLYKH